MPRKRSQAYVDLFNETWGIANGEIEQVQLGASNVGVVRWTGREKDIFFTAIARYGRHEAGKIASRIQSKSEVECQAYISELTAGLNYISETRRSQLATAVEIPAAREMSEEWIAFEEEEAMSIERRVVAMELRSCKANEPDVEHYIQDEVADRLELLFENGQTGELRSALPAAVMLSIYDFLNLASNVFMSSRDPSQDVSVHRDAFQTLADHIHAIVHKAVSFAMFVAGARVRHRARYFAASKEVHRRDVEIALQILGMPLSTQKTCWMEKIKAYKVSVINDRAKGNPAVDPAEVESQQQCGSRKKSSFNTSATLPRGAVNRESDVSIEFSRTENSTLGSHDDVDDESTSEDTLDGKEDTIDIEGLLTNEEERDSIHLRYLEHMDTVEDQNEEQALWQKLRDERSTVQCPSFRQLSPTPPVPGRETVEMHETEPVVAEWEIYRRSELPSFDGIGAAPSKRERKRKREDDGDDQERRNPSSASVGTQSPSNPDGSSESTNSSEE